MSSVVRRIEVGATICGATLDVDHLKKFVAFAAGAVALILFGDKIVPAVGHLLFLALEVLESLMDHALETIFDLDPWTAQLITAWTGFFVFLVILVSAVRRLLSFYRDLKVRFSAWCDQHPMHF